MERVCLAVHLQYHVVFLLKNHNIVCSIDPLVCTKEPGWKLPLDSTVELCSWAGHISSADAALVLIQHQSTRTTKSHVKCLWLCFNHAGAIKKELAAAKQKVSPASFVLGAFLHIFVLRSHLLQHDGCSAASNVVEVMLEENMP